MPARVVIVHDDRGFLTLLANELGEHCDTALFEDPLAALNALDHASTVDVLVSRLRFPVGKSNGISLALLTRKKRPHVKILFTGLPELASYTEGIGEFFPHPIDCAGLAARIKDMLK